MGSIRSERKLTDRLFIEPVGRALAHVASPEEVQYGIDQNRRLADTIHPYFDSLAENFTDPSVGDVLLAQELTDPLTLRSDKQNFGGLWLNRDAQGGMIARVTGFQENITETDALVRAYVFARLNPDRQLLLVDNASHGLSDDYTDSQKDDMFGKGDLSGVGEEMATAIANFIASIKADNHIDISSFSYGARQTLDVVNYGHTVGLTFGNMRLYELPGTEEGRVSVHTDYFLYEWIQDRLRFSTDWLDGFKQKFETFLDTYGDHERPKNLPNFLGRDKRAIARNFWHSVLGFDTGLNKFVGSLDHVQSAWRINGSASRIGSAALVTSQFHSIGGFDVRVIPYLTHGGIGNIVTSPAMAKLDKDIAHSYPSGTISHVPLENHIP